ncbi:MAG: phenylalanine--tRNA ligase subunit beta [Candidatus Methanoplasma sp.]|nr:phenylalanine--tRNA ligase subunit beta [Candidatus Methanoplasma sp.]
MPVINFKYGDLCSLLGQKVPHEVLIEKIPLMGADMHQTDGECEDMSVEFFPDRPDLFSVEGLARALRAFLGIGPSVKRYDVEDSEYVATVEPSVLGIRPHFACAVVKDLEMSEDVIRSMMELQEKLHMTIGRRRSKLAIGIHDLDKVSSPFRYTAVIPDEVSFVPLNHTEKMDLDGILRSHDKGRMYAHLLEGMERYPVIFDRNDNILSFPPIINGALTTVTTNTKNVFVDVTGNDWKAVKGALDIVATALAERGGRICRVRMEGEQQGYSPDLTEKPYTISMKECNRFLGLDLKKEGMEEAISKMGMDVAISGDGVTVSIPPTRLDIMHKVDVFEDVAVGYGFEHFGGPYTTGQTVGKLGDITSMSDRVRDVMIGLGFTEVTTLTLSNRRDEFELSGLPVKTSTCITNPITEDHTCLRSYLMPSLMRILRHNKHRDLPQRIFEIGFVSDEHHTVPHLCGMATASKTSFTEIRSVTDAVMREMNIDCEVSPCNYRAFVDGRGAFISSGGKTIGFFGEVSPKVVTDYDITHPVMMFEIGLSDIMCEKAGRLF